MNLPSTLKEDTHFYEQYKEILSPYLGRQYLSYSSMESFYEYKEDFIKQKLAKIKLPESPYSAFGSWAGHMLEHGEPPKENPYGFEGHENYDYSLRQEGDEYEKIIIIDRGEYIIIGFIDVYRKDGEVADQKTGGKGKEEKYSSEDYLQTVVYSHGLEEMGHTVIKNTVHFIRREKSHINPPLTLSKESFNIEIPYNKDRVKKALKKFDIAAKEISELNTTYQKFFS